MVTGLYAPYELSFVKIKHIKSSIYFSQVCERQYPLVSCIFKRYLFRLDVNNDGIFAKFIAGEDSVRLISGSRLKDRLWSCFSICREDRSDQAIGFFFAWGSPTDRTEDIVVDDGTVELGVLKT